LKLFSKYNRLNIIATVAVFLAASALFYLFLRSMLVKQMDEDLDIERKEVLGYVREHGTLPEMVPMRHLNFTFLPQQQPFTAVIFRSFEAPDSSENDQDAFRALDFGVEAGRNYYKVTVSKPLEAVENLLWPILIFVLSFILLTTLSMFLINRTVLKRLWAPFFATIKQVRDYSITKGEAMQLQRTNVDEFAILNDALIASSGKARQDYMVLKEFTENASHEMQTPLAIIRSKLDLLIQDENLSESQAGVVQSVYASIQKLNRMNQSLLLLARIGNNQFDERMAVDMEQKVKDKMASFQELWADEQIGVSTELQPVSLQMNPALADIMLNNLFSNATRHNNRGGQVYIMLNKSGLTIKNTGTEDELDHGRLYQKFYTAGKIEGNTGLGLSILKHIVDTSGYSISYSFAAPLHSFSIQFSN
jgi:signal transduction histidine kinase